MKNSSKQWDLNIRSFKFPSVLPKFYRVILLTVLFFSLLGYAVEHEGKIPFHLPSRNLSEFPTPRPAAPTIDSSVLLDMLNAKRTEKQLQALTTNASLEKAARLLSLDIEDSQVLEIPDDVRPYLASVSTHLPRTIETFAVFFSGLSDLSQFQPVASSSATQDGKSTQVGIAIRPAEFELVRGTLVVVMVSPDFVNTFEQSGQEALPTTVSQQPPSYTGEDLWQAVQNYRRAHNLPELKQANELCTVSSIRLNELIELGKLDNHDGFDERSDQFFERNPDWTAINENLASGYETAVQVVEWGWDQSLGHKALIQSREFPSACTSASQGFAVLVTGK